MFIRGGCLRRKELSSALQTIAITVNVQENPLLDDTHNGLPDTWESFHPLAGYGSGDLPPGSVFKEKPEGPTDG